MLAVVYLLVCILTGYAVCSYVIPEVFEENAQTFGKKKLRVSPYFLWIPAVTITGLFLVTWTVYLLGNLFHGLRTPLVPANAVAMTFYLILSGVLLYMKLKKGQWKKPALLYDAQKKVSAYGIEIAFLAFFLILMGWLMFYTFHIKDGNLCVGYTVYSDFSPHLSMIRSFSYGNNFPTWYPYFAGIDVKYHFMFQFLAGNLEFLGLPLDWAFNLPSIASMIFVFMLLYVLAVKITGKRLAGVLAGFLFAFRSSESLFTFLAETPEGESGWKRLVENTEFLGYTTNENWGLWNLNVYLNQRHLALCLAMMLLVLILVLPRLYETFEMWKNMSKAENVTVKDYLVQTFFTKDGWCFGSLKMAVYIGLLVGASAFWNGAALIALVLMLFFIAALARKRMDFVVMAGIAGMLSMVQSHVFMKESSISAQYFFGFIAETKNIWGTTDYIIRLIGLLAVMVVAAFLYYRGVKRYLIFVFTTPFVFSFTVSLTVDPTVNHKYIMMSCMLLDDMVASFISDFLKKKDFFRYIGGALVMILLTSTGIYDTYSIYVRNGEGRQCELNLDSELTQWVHENADSKDIFLTSNITVNELTMGGAMLYNGWQYFAWSAGYDTGYRDEQTAAMYSASTPEELKRLVADNDIRFIVVNSDVRASSDYQVNEENIANTYEAVFSQPDYAGDYTIYDTELEF